MNKKIFISGILLFVLILSNFGCDSSSNSPYKTFNMDEGMIHFTFEYPAYFSINEVKTMELTDKPPHDIAYVHLKGSLDRKINDPTLINIIISTPDDTVQDAKDALAGAESSYSSWPDYELHSKADITIDNIPACRIDFEQRNILPIDWGSSGPPMEVKREVYFYTKDFFWSIRMQSNYVVAEEEKVEFEHILSTFKILD